MRGLANMMSGDVTWLQDEFVYCLKLVAYVVRVAACSLCMTLTDQQSWNGIWWDCVWMATDRSNPDLPVVIHIQSHHIRFQGCWSVSGIHKLPYSTPDHICRQFETAFQLILQWRHTPRLNPRLPPSVNSTYGFLSVFSTLPLKKATVSVESFSSVS